jgi:hypothetical protein
VNRDEFAAVVDDAFNRMISPLANLTREFVLLPIAKGKWSLKDLAAHFVFWDKTVVHALEACFRGERFDWNALSDWDKLNAQAVADAQANPHPRIAAEWRITHLTMMEAVRRVRDEKLLENGQIPAWLIANVHDHYRHHAMQVDAWLENLKHEGKLGPMELDVLR